MCKGKVVEQGDRETVFAPPNEPYTQELLSSVPQMDPDWLTKLLQDRSDAQAKTAI
jgi:peptide/nickel transport system ATP-binding protein